MRLIAHGPPIEREAYSVQVELWEGYGIWQVRTVRDNETIVPRNFSNRNAAIRHFAHRVAEEA